MSILRRAFANARSWLWIVGLLLLVVCAERLGSKVGATWEFAGLAVGILLGIASPILLLAKRMDELEKTVAELRKG